MITIFTLTYNEELLLPFMINHYRERFSNCNIVVYDNMSTDNTVNIAKDNNCKVIPFNTNNTIDEFAYLKIKNNEWRNAATDWVLVCDVDELLEINQDQLLYEDSQNTTVILSEGYNMINMEDNYDLDNITYGSRCNPYDKYYLFNKKYIKNINYEVGCHEANPTPIENIKFSDKKYLLYHYKCINPEFMTKRYKSFASRLSEKNKKEGWGDHYLTYDAIQKDFNYWRKEAILVKK